jgi:hypothetical protein
MKKSFYFIALSLLACMGGCKKDSDFLENPPNSIVPTETVFSDPALVLSVLGDLYNRQLSFSSFDQGWPSFADFSESFISDEGAYGYVQNTGWGYGSWGVNWKDAYTYIRELNLFIERDSASTKLTDADKALFNAEGRFLRANYYFELTKRYGGIPLILHSETYDYKGDPTYLQHPRAKESEMYDFVISEAEAIKDVLPANQNDKSRASKAAALAMEARAALYAGSIARYGATTPGVSLPGGEVGIPSSKANEYYQKALTAAQAIINGGAGVYKLYKVLPDLSDNFAAIFLDKSSVNQESIFITDYKALSGRTHGFTTNNQPFSITDEPDDAGRIDPSLNLVEAFEKLDNTYAPIPTVDGSGNPIYYTHPQDIFDGRDARLKGTVMIPFDTASSYRFKGATVDIWAGLKMPDGVVITSDNAANPVEYPNGSKKYYTAVGKDGPINGVRYHTQTGFYIRKFLDPTIGSGRRGRGSDVPWIHYRLGEVLLNAAEAAFELGDPVTAAGYINQVRQRAGFTVDLLPAEITFDRIVHERRVELAFEGHILYDMKRWRLATKVWDGAATTLSDLKSNIGKADKRSTQPWGLWPYKVYNPGQPNDGKYYFQEVLPSKVTGANRFTLGNYYTNIGDDVRAANPKIVKQPNQ